MAAKSKPKDEIVEESPVEDAAEPEPKSGNWRDPDWTPAEDDNSIDARMWRTYTKR